MSVLELTDFAAITQAANTERRRNARVSRIDALRAQKAELQSTLSSRRRQLALGDGSQALAISRIVARIDELSAELERAIHALEAFDSVPAAGGDYLDGGEPVKGAKRG